MPVASKTGFRFLIATMRQRSLFGIEAPETGPMCPASGRSPSTPLKGCKTNTGFSLTWENPLIDILVVQFAPRDNILRDTFAAIEPPAKEIALEGPAEVL